MRREVLTLTLAFALAPAATSIAAQTAASKPATAATPGAGRGEAAVGKLQKYDAPTRTLTISTSKGDERFTLAPSVAIRQGTKKLGESDLAGHAGHNVKVRYTDKGGQRVAQSITIVADAMATARPKS